VSEITKTDIFEQEETTEGPGVTYVERPPDWQLWFSSEISRQIPNAVLWWPVCLAIGIGIFFALPEDPKTWSGPAIVVALLAARVFTRQALSLMGAAVLGALILAAVGFTAAQVRTITIAAPILSEEIGPTLIAGTVIQVEPAGTGLRVMLDQLKVPGLGGNETPARVRIRVPGSHGAPQIGQEIQVRAVIRPPGRPVAPGAFDFQRYSFFRQLGGVGFSLGRWQVIAESTRDAEDWSDSVSKLRARVGDRLSKSLPDESGAIARALVTGERNAVPEPLQEAYRQAGLAQMLAISGLHMSLLAGLAFIATRYALALVLPIAERFETKKIAALAALAAALFYLILSGANVPAQRAFIMIGVVLFAVLIDRTALSLRTLAWAAMVVLLLQPDALVGASFQLSFAAVIALIAVYEHVHLRSHLWDRLGDFQPIRAVVLYCAAVLVTDLIATAATAPFTAFHFHQVPAYSLLANLLAVPVMGLWIMPFGLLALVLMPFGLEVLALMPMGVGIDVVEGIARFVAGLPGSTFTTPQAEVWAIVCVGVGGLVLCLWQGHGRWLGAAFLMVGILQPWLSEPPDVLINETAEVMAVKDPEGRMILSPGRRDGFTREVWTELWGRSETKWDEADSLACDASGCIYQGGKGRASLAYMEAAVVEDCGRSDVLIAKVPSWRLCKAGARVDRFDVWRHGSHAIWFHEDGVRIKKVSEVTGKRVWNRPTWR
jgi:competence protein ComEC